MLIKHHKCSCLLVENIFINKFTTIFFMLQYTNLVKPFSILFQTNDNESQYVLCEHERLGFSIKLYNLDYHRIFK